MKKPLHIKILYFAVILGLLALVYSCKHKSPPAISGEPLPAASATPSSSYTWLSAGPAPDITAAYGLCAEALGNTIYVAYQQGAGPGRQLNVKTYSEATGWQDLGVNIAVSYSSGNPWYARGYYHVVVSCDSAGYVYVYYLSGGTWQPLGTNPVAGPNCTEASVATGYYTGSWGFEVLTAYVDNNDSGRLKGKRMYINLGTPSYNWLDLTCSQAGHSVYRPDAVRSYSLNKYEYGSPTYQLLFADTANSNEISYSYGTSNGGYFSSWRPLDSEGAVSYVCSSASYYYSLIYGYRDAGMSGRAVIKQLTSEGWRYMGGSPVSDTAARNISANGVLAAFSDDSAGGRLVVKKTDWDALEWENLGAPADTMESCSIGYLTGSIFVAYISGAADNNRLKMIITQ